MQEVAKNLIESLTESDLRELMLVMEELAEREGLRHFAKAGTETSIEGSTQNLIDSKADINDTQEALDLKANDSEVVKHSLAAAVGDFLVGAGTSTFTFVKKTLAEVKVILGLGSAAYTSSGDYAVVGKGVTNGDSHDHIGGDGAQVDHGGLGGLGDDDHSQYLLAGGSRSLCGDWDIGNGWMVQADKIRARDGDGLALYEDSGVGIFIKDGGNVGIRTTAPDYPLTVVSSAEGLFVVKTANSNDSFLAFGKDAIGMFFQSGKHGSGTALDLSFWNSSTELLKLDQNGNSLFVNGKVGMGTTSPNANAILDVVSTTKAFMPPRMTTTQKNAISSPTAGMVVYDSSLNKLCVYTTAWETITSA